MPAYVRQGSRYSLFACTRPASDDIVTEGPHIFGRLQLLLCLKTMFPRNFMHLIDMKKKGKIFDKMITYGFEYLHAVYTKKPCSLR
jgi:hypothetical protein